MLRTGTWTGREAIRLVKDFTTERAHNEEEFLYGHDCG